MTRPAHFLDVPGIFVTGTDTGVGKTVATAAIGLAARASGRDTVALKAAQTGLADGIFGDAEFVQLVLGTREPIEAISPIRLGAPLAPTIAAQLEGRRVDPGVARLRFDELRSRHDLVLVEGAGGLLVPFAEGVDMAGLALVLGLPIVVVARPSLGTLNHTLLTLEAAHRRGLTVLGVILSGWPAEPDLACLTNPAALARLTPVPILGVLPADPALDVDAGRPGDIRSWGASAIDPLLGGTLSVARFRREVDRRLDALRSASARGV